MGVIHINAVNRRNQKKHQTNKMSAPIRESKNRRSISTSASDDARRRNELQMKRWRLEENKGRQEEIAEIDKKILKLEKNLEKVMLVRNKNPKKFFQLYKEDFQLYKEKFVVNIVKLLFLTCPKKKFYEKLSFFGVDFRKLQSVYGPKKAIDIIGFNSAVKTLGAQKVIEILGRKGKKVSASQFFDYTIQKELNKGFINKLRGGYYDIYSKEYLRAGIYNPYSKEILIDHLIVNKSGKLNYTNYQIGIIEGALKEYGLKTGIEVLGKDTINKFFKNYFQSSKGKALKKELYRTYDLYYKRPFLETSLQQICNSIKFSTLVKNFGFSQIVKKFELITILNTKQGLDFVVKNIKRINYSKYLKKAIRTAYIYKNPNKRILQLMKHTKQIILLCGGEEKLTKSLGGEKNFYKKFGGSDFVKKVLN
jgi:hypothetical protein